MKTLKLLALAAFAGLLFTGCCRNCRVQQTPPSTDRLQKVWQLIQLDGRSVDAVNKYELTFFDTGSLAGIGECNRYFGPYDVLNANGGIRIGAIASTMKACLGNNIETQYFKMLETITLYQFDGDKLYLFQGNAVRAVFQATNKPVFRPDEE